MPIEKLKADLMQAALDNVAFDGWGAATFDYAVQQVGCDAVMARVIFPRGALDMAITYHQMGDDAMLQALSSDGVKMLKTREKVAFAIMTRLSVADKEAVRRGMALFSLPQNAVDGTRIIWATVDHIWQAIGDTSDDYNWYSKRAILSAVYSASVLYWLGDDSIDHANTRDFIARRIENVMQFEKIKAQPAAQRVLNGPLRFLSAIKAPNRNMNMPG